MIIIHSLTHTHARTHARTHTCMQSYTKKIELSLQLTLFAVCLFFFFNTSTGKQSLLIL